jgi:hypothetical protein
LGRLQNQCLKASGKGDDAMGNRSSNYHDFEIELLTDPRKREAFILFTLCNSVPFGPLSQRNQDNTAFFFSLWKSGVWFNLDFVAISQP